MQDPSTSDTHHERHDRSAEQLAGPSFSHATTRVVRFCLYALSVLGGAATGTSVVALVLYQPFDRRWALLGAAGVLAGACAVRLIAYFPKDEEGER
ncbi:MAG: hypothetical protein AB1942_02670 [Pseudomonadota bacterium]